MQFVSSNDFKEFHSLFKAEKKQKKRKCMKDANILDLRDEEKVIIFVYPVDPIGICGHLRKQYESHIHHHLHIRFRQKRYSILDRLSNEASPQPSIQCPAI